MTNVREELLEQLKRLKNGRKRIVKKRIEKYAQIGRI